MAFYSVLGFNLSYALDESKLNELIEKKVKEVLAKQEKAKHKRVDRSGLFAGLGYSGMYSWNVLPNGFLSTNWTNGRIDNNLLGVSSETYMILDRKNPNTLLNGANFKVGYQYIAPVKIKNMSFGVRGGFQYAYSVGDYMDTNTVSYQYRHAFFNNNDPLNQIMKILNPWLGTTQTQALNNLKTSSSIIMNTYSFFIDFLHNVYENDKLFVGYFIGAGLGGESVQVGYFGRWNSQVAQFQGYGSLGLRVGDRHHTLELSASIHGDAPNCSKKKPKTCESIRPMQVKIPRGFFESYVTWSADYVYRF
ncbi:outer membrane beta-barrel protein [Helicobacter cetorum]|uniref:outer membrane beta-barrel protein n=1 Tax=Helicobacter cetorum TaxID=138563 RepID=UPI000CF1277A